MANTYSKLYVHVVFAVKGRESLISGSWREKLYKYICGIVNNNQQKVYAINGVQDHIHILLSVKPNILLSDLIRDIKANSTRWINENKFVKGIFHWQEGFGAFSVSQSMVDKTIKYINEQENHHAKISFKNEYLDLLKTYEIEFDERFIFDEIYGNEKK